ncbi:MAG: hypothetical protein JWO83_2033 [Caulobacteraceae bacterium]|jgi:hypothetical protein|nr:hypothetical protein [Caulobacteraceae bacterium]
MLKKLVLGAVAVALFLPAGAAFAHDENDGRSNEYGRYTQDYRDHGAYRDEGWQSRDGGFYGRDEHARWHERDREQRHQYRPRAWHSQYGWRGSYGGSQYGNPYGSYNAYGYQYRGY